MKRTQRTVGRKLPRTPGLWVVLIAAATLLCFGTSGAFAQPELRPSQRLKQIPPDLPPDEAAVAELYLQVLPAVVAVYVETDRETETGLEITRAHGSGVVVSAEGQVLTAAHLLSPDKRILVRTQDGVERPAEMVLTDEASDLAVVQLTGELPSDLATATLGDSDQLAVGQRVIVIGSPFGLVNSLSVGRISGFREAGSKSDELPAEFIQTDAAINLGNSGGPLFDSTGRLVAIASSYWTVDRGSGGVGFAATINTAADLFDRTATRAIAEGSAPPAGIANLQTIVEERRAVYPGSYQ